MYIGRSSASAWWAWRQLGLAICPCSVPVVVGATLQDIGPHRGQLIASLLVALLVIVGWNLVIATGGRFTAPIGVDGKAQVAFLARPPRRHSWHRDQNIARLGTNYIREMAGTIGWEDVTQPDRFHELVRAAFALALVSCVAERAQLPSAVRTVTLVSVIASIGLVFLSLYVIWTVVGHTAVDGVQDRYFLPLLPFLPLMVAGLWPCAQMSNVLAVPALILVPLATRHYTFRAVTMFHAP